MPSVIGTYGKFKQNSSSFTWPAFDSTRSHWDLTQYPGGQWSRVSLVDWTTGQAPAPESMQADAPDPSIMEIDTLGSGSVQYTYEYKDSSALYTDGIDFTLSGYRVIGNYRPDAAVYATPMHYGSNWSSSVGWQYEFLQGFPYSASETHTKNVVAKGKVKVPVSGDYYWPCLVIRDHYTYADNYGQSDDRWIYEWVVPGHFSGANGVAGSRVFAIYRRKTQVSAKKSRDLKRRSVRHPCLTWRAAYLPPGENDGVRETLVDFQTRSF